MVQGRPTQVYVAREVEAVHEGRRVFEKGRKIQFYDQVVPAVTQCHCLDTTESENPLYSYTNMSKADTLI